MLTQWIRDYFIPLIIDLFVCAFWFTYMYMYLVVFRFILLWILEWIDPEFLIAFNVLLIYIIFYIYFSINTYNDYINLSSKEEFFLDSFSNNFENYFLENEFLKNNRKELFKFSFLLFFLEKNSLFFSNILLLLKNKNKFVLNYLNSIKSIQNNIINKLLVNNFELIYFYFSNKFFNFLKNKKLKNKLNFYSFISNINKFIFIKWNVLLHDKWWIK